MGLSEWRVLAIELAKGQSGGGDRSFAALPSGSVIWVDGG